MNAPICAARAIIPRIVLNVFGNGGVKRPNAHRHLCLARLAVTVVTSALKKTARSQRPFRSGARYVIPYKVLQLVDGKYRRTIIQVRDEDDCPNCDGVGWVDKCTSQGVVPCYVCQGGGTIYMDDEEMIERLKDMSGIE